MLENLAKYKILLGSKSPRRRELLTQLRVPFTTITMNGTDESYPDTLESRDVPQYLSAKKAKAFDKMLREDELLITADTLVICKGKILGKPKDKDEAVEILMMLSGCTHQVATGVTITTLKKTVSFTTVTNVTFSDLTHEEAKYYVDNYSPLDKAGAYGIQEWIGCVAVSGIEGSFYNVMGLPVHQLYKHLKQF